MRHAFVSHSTADDSYVAEMEAFLYAAGYDKVFNDVRTIAPDERFWVVIEKGIADADTLVVVLTSASNSSEWVKREVEYARSLSKKIIPVWIEDCPVPAIFHGRDVIDFRPRTRAELRSDISRIFKYAPGELIGREDKTKLLSNAWQKVMRFEKGRPHILTFVALRGEGKTSLVAKWAADLAHQDWPGCDAVFAWSFYSQGTREQTAVSSDLFLAEALTFFGDAAMASSAQGAFEKGRRLAQLVGERRSLIILDGLEPLQYAPTSPTPGELKDQGIAALLKGLAATSHGLCVVTTRYSIPDLRAFLGKTVREVKLLRLSREAGVHLLKTLGVTGTAQEFEKLVEDVKGHALTLTLLGGFLKRAFHGDIRQRDRVKFEKADEKMDGGHTFRTMAAYEQWLLRDGGDEGQREVAVLRLMGLFDRPADTACLAAMRSGTIPGFTEPLADLAEDDWEYCLSGLETAKLLTVNRDTSGALVSLDAHPHLREYFARQLRTQQPSAWRAAHRLLYEHLCATTKEGDQPTLEGLQPLYQAVTHGCQAGLQQEACVDLYRDRIIRKTTSGDLAFYSTDRLGAVASDLAALSCFFTSHWAEISSQLNNLDQAWVLNLTAYRLGGLGRLSEARDCMESAMERYRNQSPPDWAQASLSAGSLSHLELILGRVRSAIQAAEMSVNFADMGDKIGVRVAKRGNYGQTLHHAGKFEEARLVFVEAEQLQPDQRLQSVEGFRYCDLLLAAPERAAWRMTLIGSLDAPEETNTHRTTLQLVSQRGRKMRELRAPQAPLLTIALDHVILGRAALYEAVFGKAKNAKRKVKMEKAESELKAGMDYLRRAGWQDELPHGLLTRAWLRFLTGTLTGPESAQEDLNEAWEIAARGPMRLRMVDIHLHRARLFFREAQYPWESPQADLAAAEKLINDCGYHRRDEELADAKAAILSS